MTPSCIAVCSWRRLLACHDLGPSLPLPGLSLSRPWALPPPAWPIPVTTLGPPSPCLAYPYHDLGPSLPLPGLSLSRPWALPPPAWPIPITTLGPPSPCLAYPYHDLGPSLPLPGLSLPPYSLFPSRSRSCRPSPRNCPCFTARRCPSASGWITGGRGVIWSPGYPQPNPPTPPPRALTSEKRSAAKQ